MKHIHLLLLSLIFNPWNRVCGQNYSMFPNKNEPFDPYFVETRDTASTKFGSRILTRNIVQAKNGDLWFATWKGIVSYDGKVFTNHTLKEGLIHAHVFSVFEDKSGNLWFGSACGLYRYDGKSFKLFTTKDGLVNNNVMSITEDKTGNIWLGTDGGVSYYDGKSFVNFSNQNGLNDKFVNSILQDKTGKLWFAASNGLTCYDGKTFKAFKNKDGSAFERVASLFEDKNGNIWIGSEQGLWRYDGKSLSDPLTTNLVMYLCQDNKGNLWFACNTYPIDQNFTLYCYKGNYLTKIVEMTDAANGWQIFGIMEDKAGNIWFGTMNGPCRYDGKSFTYFTN